MEAFSEYVVLTLLVLMFSIPVLMNLVSARRKKGQKPQDEVGKI